MMIMMMMETQQSQYTRNALTCCELACCCGSQQAAWICSVCNWNWTSILSSQMNWAPLIQHNYCQITIQHWDRNKHNVVCNSNGLGYAQHNTKAPKTLLARVEWYVVASPFSSIVIQMNRTSAPMLPCVVERTKVQCCCISDHKLTNWQCSCVRVILFSICVNVGEPTKTWFINYVRWHDWWKVHKVSQKHPTSLGIQIANWKLPFQIDYTDINCGDVVFLDSSSDEHLVASLPFSTDPETRRLRM